MKTQKQKFRILEKIFKSKQINTTIFLPQVCCYLSNSAGPIIIWQDITLEGTICESYEDAVDKIKKLKNANKALVDTIIHEVK